MADTIQSAVDAVRADQQANPSAAPVVQQQPFPVSQIQQVTERQAREKGKTAADYLGAMWRQDSWIPGAIDHYAGSQLQPDESYNPHQEETWKDLTTGVWPEFHNQLAQSTSAGQAAWIKQNILQKQKDLMDLGDLGTAGNVGRFAAGLGFGIIDPINLAAMAASGGASLAGKAGQVAMQANRTRQVAAGLGTAGVLGAATEKIRQNYNFEDDSTAVLQAGIASMAFSAPFIGLHIREQARLQKAAGIEKQAIDSLAKLQRGEELALHETASLKTYADNVAKAAEVETGRASPDVYAGALKADGPEPIRFTAEQRKAYADAFAEHDRMVSASKAADLNTIWNDAHVAKASEDQRVADVLTRVNGPDTPPTAMQMAFAMALGKKPEELAPAPKAAPRVAPEEPHTMSHETVWWDEGSGINEGRVVDVDDRGNLTVEHPDTGETTVVNREDLHDLSPRYRAPEPATGFLGGSIGAAQVGHVGGLWEQSTAMAATPAKGWLPSIPTRWDFFTHLNQSENPHLQYLGFKLVKDAIGIDKYEAQGWSASELKSQYRRTMGGLFHQEARQAFDEAVKARGLSWGKAISFHREFYEDVARVARGDAEVLKANQDIAPQLQRAAKQMQDFYAGMREKMIKAGVQGSEDLPQNPQYVTRQWRQDNIREAHARYGDDLYNMLGDAINIPGISHADRAVKAKKFLDTVMKLEFSHAMQDIHLYSRDAVTLRDELGKAGLVDHEIDNLVDLMFERRPTKEADAGNAGNLKARLNLNENFSARMKDGSVFRVADLFENDSRVLVDRYLNSMGGHLALAEVGIRSRAEFMKIMRDAEKHHAENASMTQSAEKFNRNKQFAQDLYDNITGRPMSTQSFNRADRFLSASRAVTRSTMLGQLGLMSALEMKNALALSSFRAMRLHMPTLFGILRSFRAGHKPSQALARDIEMIVGFGREHVAGYSRQNEITDFTYDRGLSRYENASNTLSHAVDYMSGNSHFTSATRNLTGRMMVQKHLDFATERVKMSESQKHRMVHQGVSYDDIADVHAALKKYTDVDPENGAAREIDWETWSKDRPETYSKFQLLMSREVRDAIQDHDIGETIPFQHTTVGKIFTELKTFSIAAHVKQFLKGMHYRDSTTMVQWLISFVGACLEYSMQQSINLAHDPEKLSERLAPGSIAISALPRMSVLGLMPNLLETLYNPISGGQQLFANGTANTDNRNLFITPSMTQAMRMMSLGQVTMGTVNPLSTNTITQKDMRDALYAIPGGNLYGMRNLNDMISSQFPKHKPRAD